MVAGLDGDWGWIDKGLEDENYDVSDDSDELYKRYKCDCCQRIFTLDEAASDFASRVNGISYFSISEAGDLCGNCAAEIYS